MTEKKKDSSMAFYIWWSILAVHAFWAVWGLLADLALIREEDQSITNYLRGAPWAFLVPSLIGLLAWGILFWHLFIQAHNGAAPPADA